MKSLVLLTVFLALVSSACSAIRCLPNVCDTVRCAAVSAEECGGEIVKNGGWCGCCDSCVKILQPGESCGIQLSGVPDSEKCLDDYFCERSSNTCQPIIF